MSYEWRYINKNKQPSFVSYTLLIENEEQNYRIEKFFKINEQQIDDEFLRLEAKKEIAKIEFEKQNPTTIPEQDQIDNGSISE